MTGFDQRRWRHECADYLLASVCLQAASGSKQNKDGAYQSAGTIQVLHIMITCYSSHTSHLHTRTQPLHRLSAGHVREHRSSEPHASQSRPLPPRRLCNALALLVVGRAFLLAIITEYTSLLQAGTFIGFQGPQHPTARTDAPTAHGNPRVRLRGRRASTEAIGSMIFLAWSRTPHAPMLLWASRWRIQWRCLHVSPTLWLCG